MLVYHFKQMFLLEIAKSIVMFRYQAGHSLYDNRTNKFMSEENKLELEEFYNDVSVKLFETITKFRKDIEK